MLTNIHFVNQSRGDRMSEIRLTTEELIEMEESIKIEQEIAEREVKLWEEMTEEERRDALAKDGCYYDASFYGD